MWHDNCPSLYSMSCIKSCTLYLYLLHPSIYMYVCMYVVPNFPLIIICFVSTNKQKHTLFQNGCVFLNTCWCFTFVPIHFSSNQNDDDVDDFSATILCSTASSINRQLHHWDQLERKQGHQCQEGCKGLRLQTHNSPSNVQLWKKKCLLFTTQNHILIIWRILTTHTCHHSHMHKNKG